MNARWALWTATWTVVAALAVSLQACDAGGTPDSGTDAGEVDTGASGDGTAGTGDGTGATEHDTWATEDDTGATDDDTGATGDDTAGAGDDTAGTGDDTAGTGDGTGATGEEPVDCAADADCDDGLSCTSDGCVGDAYTCAWTLQPGSCLIHGVCRGDGEAKPGDGCRACAPANSAWSWTPVDDGTACDDGDACTPASTCEAGSCIGTEGGCDDGDACTADTCDADEGCVHTPLGAGSPCDDGDACTLQDVCWVASGCAGDPVVCDDDNPCTDEICDPGSGTCATAWNEAPCEDGDLCTAGDACAEGACVSGEAPNCDDGNICTINLCDPAVGCHGLPTQSPCCAGLVSFCDDGDPCTSDLCDPGTGACAYEPNSAACDDGDACTAGDVCGDGVCGGAPVSCDDGNPCTDDPCGLAEGCYHVPLDGVACDDGLACSTGDACVAGACLGDTSACTCTPSFAPDAGKISGLAMGTEGAPGQGLDIDADPSTCSPDGCSGGVDNALSILASFANSGIADAVAGGSLLLILEFDDLGSGGAEVAVHQGELDPQNAACDITAQKCSYLVSASGLDDETCEPLVKLPATLDGTHLIAGGPDSALPFSIPLQETVVLDVLISNVQLDATVTLDGGDVIAFTGLLGGAIPKSNLLAAVDALPADGLPPPLDKGLIKSFIEILEPDIDSDGNGSLDALSLGLAVEGIDALITGVE